MNSVEKYILDNYTESIDKYHYRFYNVEFKKSHQESILRLFIEPADEQQTMDIDACEKISRTLSDLFDGDANFPITDAYTFEVSSPGIERTLYTPEHFQRYIGEKIRVGLYKAHNGKKELIAILQQADDACIQLDCNGETIDLDYKDISKAQLYCDF